MTPTQLKELQASLRDRAKPRGNRQWIDENQRLAGDLANVIGHIRDMEDDAERGFHDAQDAANNTSYVPLKGVHRTVRHEVDISEDDVMQTSDDVAKARSLLIAEHNMLIEEKERGGYIDDSRLTLVRRVLCAFDGNTTQILKCECCDADLNMSCRECGYIRKTEP